MTAAPDIASDVLEDAPASPSMIVVAPVPVQNMLDECYSGIQVQGFKHLTDLWEAVDNGEALEASVALLIDYEFATSTEQRLTFLASVNHLIHLGIRVGVLDYNRHFETIRGLTAVSLGDELAAMVHRVQVSVGITDIDEILSQSGPVSEVVRL